MTHDRPRHLPGTQAPTGTCQTIYIVGTWDTKAREMAFLAEHIRNQGALTITVDVGTNEPANQSGGADIPATVVAAHHPDGAATVFTGERGSAVTAMSAALKPFLASRGDLAGVIGVGGSGGTALLAPGFRALRLGVPKIIVSTVASGQVGGYIDASDLVLMPSITDLAGLNRISRHVLGGAGAAITAMARAALESARLPADEKPALGLTMFGVTTPCVDAISRLLADRYDCLVFHATGVGGRTMEKLVDAGMIDGVIDATMTEVADLIVGGVMAAGADRLGAIARRRVPYVGSVGACDMVNFGSLDSVPGALSARLFHVHNPHITLMRTTIDENVRIGAWIAERLNRCAGPVRFFLPEGGISALDAPGMPFYDPHADSALFDAIEQGVEPEPSRRVIRLPYHINDPAFAGAMARAFEEIRSEARHARA